MPKPMVAIPWSMSTAALALAASHAPDRMASASAGTWEESV